MAVPDGNGAKPSPQGRETLPGQGPDRPEAFGRGEHPEPKQDPKQGDAKKPDEEKPEGQKPDQVGKQKKDGKEKEEDPRPFWKRPALMIALVSVLAILGGSYLAWRSYHYQSTDDAFIDGRIVRVAPRVSGKVLKLLVDDNQPVEADATLIEIDPQPFQVKLDQANAAERQAEAQQAQAEANLTVAEAQALQADADVTVAQANARNAQQDFERFSHVSAQARSQQQLDSAVANQKATAATVDAQMKKADAMHAQAKAAQTTVNAAIANVHAAQSQVEQAQLDLSYCHVVAGHRGRVTRRQVEVGNYVTVGQEILDVVPTEVPDIWVTANFKESQLAHMEAGQQVTITVDAFPDQTLHGHVDSIQNGTGAVFSLLPAENATGNYVKVVQRVPVKIVLDDAPRHLLSPGLSVEPEVDITGHPEPSRADSSAGRTLPPPSGPATTRVP